MITLTDSLPRAIGRWMGYAVLAAGLLTTAGVQARPGTADRTPGMIPPVNPACVSSPYGPRVIPNRPLAGTFHYGIDLPAPEGAPVRVVAPGTVIRVQRHGPGGLEMLVQHNGFVTIYSHLGLIAPAIAEGRRELKAGEQIGVVGRTGVTYGMHLYFGMLVNGHPIDPAGFLGVSSCTSAMASAIMKPVVTDPRLPPSRTYAGS